MAIPSLSTPMESAGAGVPESMLIFELEAVEPKDREGGSRAQAPCELQRSLQVLATCQTHFEERLLRDVRSYKHRLLREEGEVDTVVLATHLAAVGYKVTIRTAVGGGAGQECFHNLHYEFLRVTDEHNFQQYVVDSRFREQFQISQSTEEYQGLLASVPEEYVGTTGRLIPMVKLLCSQMQEAFQATSRTIPPWRKAGSMISKWAPNKARDTAVASPSSSPEAYHGKGLIGMSPRGPLSRSNSGATASSCASSRSCMSHAIKQAKPILRQSGFEPTAAFTIGPSLQSIGEALQLERRSHSADAPGWTCKDSARSALRSGAGQALKTAQSSLPLENWQEPRIRTVKMGGDRLR